MDEAYKHYVEQKKLDPEEYTLWFYLYEVQKHSDFVYDVRNQAGGYPCCEVVTRQGGLGGFWGASILFGVLVWALVTWVVLTLWKFNKEYTYDLFTFMYVCFILIIFYINE